MSTAGPLAPTAIITANIGGTYVAWTNPTNALAQDGVFATNVVSGQRTDRLITATYNAGIPSNTTLLGVQVRIKGKSSTGTASLTVLLWGTWGTSPTSYTWTPTTTNADANFGGTADVWGLSATYTNDPVTYFDASNFGVDLFSSGTNTCTFSVDYVEVTLTYQTHSVTNNKTITVTSTGTATRILSVGKPLPVTSTGTVSVLKSVGKTLATLTSTGTASVLKSVGKTFATLTSTGTASLSRSLTFGKTLAVTSLSTVSLVASHAAGLVLSVTSTWTAPVAKAVGKAFSLVSSGTVSATVGRLINKVFSVTSTGALLGFQAVSSRIRNLRFRMGGGSTTGTATKAGTTTSGDLMKGGYTGDGNQ